MSVAFFPIVEMWWCNTLEIWKISFDINCIFIKLWALVPWIENSKIRLRISPSRWWPLPVPIVDQHIIINQLGCEIFLALAPVNTKNFDEKVGSEHSSTVVHISFIKHVITEIRTLVFYLLCSFASLQHQRLDILFDLHTKPRIIHRRQPIWSHRNLVWVKPQSHEDCNGLQYVQWDKNNPFLQYYSSFEIDAHLAESKNLSSTIDEQVRLLLVLANDDKLLGRIPIRISDRLIDRLSFGQAYYHGLCHTKVTYNSYVINDEKLTVLTLYSPRIFSAWSRPPWTNAFSLGM